MERLLLLLQIFTQPPSILTPKQVTIETHPYQLSLRGSHGYHLCSATTLSEKIAITAAQCLRDQPSYSIKAGVSNLLEPGIIVEVEKVLSHPNFTEMYSGPDVALLFLASPLPLSEKIKAAKLPQQGVDEGMVGVVSSWGDSKGLEAVQLGVLDRGRCLEEHGWWTGVGFCAGLTGGGFVGDVGAPFVQGGVLYGVASWGGGCARGMGVRVFVDVKGVEGFIREYVNNS